MGMAEFYQVLNFWALELDFKENMIHTKSSPIHEAGAYGVLQRGNPGIYWKIN